MIAIKNNSVRANATRIIFYIMMLTAIVSLYSYYLQFQLLLTVESGKQIIQEYTDSNDTRQQVIAIVLAIVAIVSIVLFIMWFYRAYKNLHELKINTLNFTPGWAIGAWFVPILNLGRPYVIMREIWDETQYYVLDKNEKQNVTSNAIVGWWWGLWIVHSVSGRVLGSLATGTKTIDALKNYTYAGMINELINMVSMIVALIMINKMMDYENKLFEFVTHQQSLPKAKEQQTPPPSIDSPAV